MMAQPARPLPDAGLLRGDRHRLPPSLLQAPWQRLTTSGRAALCQALRLSQAPGRPRVLLPSYHCPSMVAAVLHAGLEPTFVPIGTDGRLQLQRLDATQAGSACALVVPQLFGRLQALAAERQWCDQHRIRLIEDCAHSLFGSTQGHPAGHWGDYAIASLSKFLPVPEAGLLASWHHRLPSPDLPAQGMAAEVRALADLLERTCLHGRLSMLQPLFALKRRLRRQNAACTTSPAAPAHAQPTAALLQHCDMARIELAPLRLSRALLWLSCRDHTLARRRDNHARLHAGLSGRLAGHALYPDAMPPPAPYVYPYWSADADHIYPGLRAQGVAVLRWERCWPGSEALDGDAAPGWRRHVLQFLCHPQLSAHDIDHTIACALALQAHQPAPPC